MKEFAFFLLQSLCLHSFCCVWKPAADFLAHHNCTTMTQPCYTLNLPDAELSIHLKCLIDTRGHRLL